VLILLDDVGFGAASTFGGAIQTPALNALARDGLRYNRFHTAAICSPTRAALLSGRNPHATGIGAVMNTADARPGYSGFQTKETATIAEVLRQNGYATGAFGKWHQTPDWEASQAGPFDRWPTGEGFEKFYGFIGGETDQYEPTLFDGTTPVMRPPGAGYHLTKDLADQAIKWMRNVKAGASDKPFFLYFPTGGAHAPLQAPEDWIKPYRGKFDQGWDRLRQETYQREKRLGVIPANAKLTPRPADLPAWDTLTSEQKLIAARLMEAYAGFLAHTDAQVGRLMQELKDSGAYENTLVIYIVGDNGASAEGGLLGSLNYMAAMQGLPEPDAQKLARIDQIGAPSTYPHINAAWAWAMNAPFQWTKTVASHLGGTRNPMVVSWPKVIKDRGGLRSQFSYVSDIAPTILDVVGIAAPVEVNGVWQKPITGKSIAYSFKSRNAPEQRHTQYFEVFGNRAVYHNGWMASAFHGRLPWSGISAGRPTMEEDPWELYDLRTDFSQSKDLAGQYPEKLKDLQAVFMKEAAANQVLPLSGVRPLKEGLPDPSAGLKRAVYGAGVVGLPEFSLPKTANRSWSWEATLTTGKTASGVVAALGGREGGLSLYIDSDQKPVFVYKLFDMQTLTLKGDVALKPGAHHLKTTFNYDGGGFGKGGLATLSVDGAEAASGRLMASAPLFFSISENFGVGLDTGSAVGDYPQGVPLGFPISDAQIHRVEVVAD
jgi:arylsulfatase A-like enzyme